MDVSESLKRRYLTIRRRELASVFKVQDEIVSSIKAFLKNDGLVEILAPIVEPVTDPGIRGVKQVTINYYLSRGLRRSGFKRQAGHRYEKLVERMQRSGENLSQYEWYLDMLKGGIPPSAGFGIGVERLARFICKLENIWDAVPFPKVAGVHSP